MNKKIGILTLNGYYNYGNRLQNYATQETLKEFNFEVHTIVNTKTKKKKKSSLQETVKRISKKSIKDIYLELAHKFLIMIKYNEIQESKKIRTEKFKDFTYEYIKEVKETIPENDVPNALSNKYNYFITGSDQVWKPSELNYTDNYFLTFAPKHKRIAYAPSFGISKLGPGDVKRYKKWISGMHKLSVRENEGAKIIKNLTGRDAPVHVDPTMLITKEKWLSVAKAASNKPKERYLLTYFLGGIPNAYKKQITNIAKDNNLKIINLGDIKEKETYRTGPSEFIDYINSCTVFCTDSFHGAVFSILMEKDFIVYERVGSSASMFSRITTLLDKFQLSSRKSENIEVNEDIFNTDYSHVSEILEEERKKSFDYLKEALNITNEA